MEMEFDFVVPSMNNGITYHAKWQSEKNKYLLSWELENTPYTDMTDKEKLQDYLDDGFWKIIKRSNKNRRLE